MSKKLWGGRFTKKIDKDFYKFQKSIQYDHKLAKYDITHSLMHTAALEKAGVLSAEEKEVLIKFLRQMHQDVKEKKFRYSEDSEDIHTDIHNKAAQKLGKLALKLHTSRSRNDQIAFDEKAYCYDQGISVSEVLRKLLSALKSLKNTYKKLFIVGYTHTQRAQKVSMEDYLDAFYLMFERDRKRLTNFWQNIEIHIGAGALAGSAIKDKYGLKVNEKIEGRDFIITPSKNAIDDVSDRDFIIEFLSILSILQMHMSRLAEDFILYSTKEFGFMDLPEEFCTGSSMLPHKKNPDFLELVRGYTGRIYGSLISVLTTMKGLPLTYNRDMQLDKEPLFTSVSIVKDELRIMAKLVKNVKLNKAAIAKALKDPDLNTFEEAQRLALNKKMAFKEAHDKIGKKAARRK